MSLATIRLRAVPNVPIKARFIQGAVGPQGETGATGAQGPQGNPGEVQTANSPQAGEFARFTDAVTIEGRTADEVLSDLGLTSIAGLGANGFVTRTAEDTFTTRLIVGTALETEVDFGSGAAGNPTIRLHAGVYRSGGTDVAVADGGTGASTAAAARTSLELVGQQTIWVPAGAMTARTTNGAASGSLEAATNDVMAKYLAFDSTTSEGAQFAIQMPKAWNEGTIVAQFVWMHPATVTNFGVTWGIRAVAFGNDDALDAAFGTEQEIADTGGTTSDVYITSETAAMTVAGSPATEELVVFEVYRDPADGGDTMAVDAYLLGVKIHYTTDAARDD